MMVADSFWVLDTETTGLRPDEGNRIIEIGLVQVKNRRLGTTWSSFVNPEGRASSPEARAIHGISDDLLATAPRFADLWPTIKTMLGTEQIVIHNAPFDTGFLNTELQRMGEKTLDPCRIVDTMAMARGLYPGQRCSLDALCARFGVDATARADRHGALIDACLLAHVYLAMTAGQAALFGEEQETPVVSCVPVANNRRQPLPVIKPSPDEERAHEAFLEHLEKTAGVSLWREHAEG